MNIHQRKNLPATYTHLAFGVGGILIILAFLLVFSPSNKVRANSTDMNNAITKYPSISRTRLDSCSLCHSASLPALNPYGSDYASHNRNNAAFGLIENLDSDGDGFTNIQEINALYFPGNATDHPPANTPTPTQTSTLVPPSPTSTSTSLAPTPTQTSTPVPPTSTQTSTTVPPTPTQTSTTVPPTPTQTSTSVPPTPTGTSISIPPTPTATSTPLQPTATPTTSPPTPTATLLPPLPTELPPTPIAPPPTSDPPSLDLDICWVGITPRIRLGANKPVQLSVAVSKRSQVEGKGAALVTGTQNGVVIYQETQNVQLGNARECRWFNFPSYTPTKIGSLRWTVQVVEGDTLDDTKTATTRVTKSMRDRGDWR